MMGPKLMAEKNEGKMMFESLTRTVLVDQDSQMHPCVYMNWTRCMVRRLHEESSRPIRCQLWLNVPVVRVGPTRMGDTS